jgi:hypothetical protein
MQCLGRVRKIRWIMFRFPAEARDQFPVSTLSLGTTRSYGHTTAQCTETQNVSLVITILHLVLNFGLKIITELSILNAICNTQQFQTKYTSLGRMKPSSVMPCQTANAAEFFTCEHGVTLVTFINQLMHSIITTAVSDHIGSIIRE